MEPARRFTNARVANAIGAVAFTVTLGVLALTGIVVAMLDPGRTTGPHPALALLVLVGASTVVALLVRLVAALVLKGTRPEA